jgi:hypothetical protein
MLCQTAGTYVAGLVGRTHGIVPMKTVMTRITCDVMMDKNTVPICKAFNRFAYCYNLTGRFMTESARGHTIFAIDLF